MGVDLGKVKDRQKQEEQKAAARASGGQRYLDKLQVGENPLRILPPWTDEGPNANDFCREIYQHWGVDPNNPKAPVTCPKRTHGLDGECPICDYVQALRKTGDPGDAERAAKIMAKVRYYSNVIDLNDPVFTQKDLDEAKAAGREVKFSVGDTKVKIWRYGASIYKGILDYFSTLKTDITDLQSGRDVVVMRKGTGVQDTKYNVIMRDASPVTIVGANFTYDLDRLNPAKTSVELSGLLAGTPGAVVSAPGPAMAAPPPAAQLPAQAAPPPAPAIVAGTATPPLPQQDDAAALMAKMQAALKE